MTADERAIESGVSPMRVFLSYAHGDAEFVTRLEADLAANGVNVWRDIKAIAPGESITRSIEGALRNCNALLLVLSARSTASSWVEREYRAALHLQSGNPDVEPRIVPCLLENCDVPVFLKDVLYADFRSYEPGFVSLAKSLGIGQPSIPSVRLRDDIKELLTQIEAATESLRQERFPSPSHELFDVWSPLEDELLRLLALEYALGSPKQLDRRGWEISGMTDQRGRPLIDQEPYPRNLFVYRLAGVLQGAVQLAARYGHRSEISQDFEKLFWWLGGTPASN